MAAEHEAFKVWPTNADRETFRLVTPAGAVSEIESSFPRVRRKWQRKYDPRPRLAEAYLYFHEAVHSYCTGSTDGTIECVVARANALHEALRRHLLLVHIELSKDDDPQVIFESLARCARRRSLDRCAPTATASPCTPRCSCPPASSSGSSICAAM